MSVVDVVRGWLVSGGWRGSAAGSGGDGSLFIPSRPGGMTLTKVEQAREDAATVDWLRELNVSLKMPPVGMVVVDDVEVCAPIVNDHAPPTYVNLTLDGEVVRKVPINLVGCPDGCRWEKVALDVDLGWSVRPDDWEG